MTREEIIEYFDTFNVHGDIKVEEMADDLAQPQRMRGRWINSYRDGFGNAIGHCDQCGLAYPMSYNFCPSCGADMRGEQDG